MGPSLGFVSNVFTRPRMGPSLGFVSNVFFLGSTSVTYYGLFYCIIWFVLRHCWSLIAPLDLYCANVSQYYLSFKLSGKVVFFPLLCHLSFLFVRSCCNSAFILELHRCSKGRSISRVQKENCYYFRNGFCLSLWVNFRVGYCHCHLKCVLRSIRRVQTENCTFDKQSPYVKLSLFSKRVLLVIVSETVEWAIAMLVAPLELYCAIVSGYYLSFKLSGKVVFLLGPELPTGDGWERASHWSCIAPLEIIFLDTIWVSSDQERFWRIWRWFVIWCGEFVWQWRKFKREMWRSCFRKTLCGLKRNKGCWLNARRIKRISEAGRWSWLKYRWVSIYFYNARRRLPQNRVYP